MSPLDIAVVRRKLARIAEELSRLHAAASLSLREWESDADRRAAAERRLQICIEAATDVNAHLLVGLGHPAPESGYQSFADLANKARIIPADLAADLAPSAGLRNRLVHEYDEIDDALVLEGLRVAVRLFPRYVEAVAAYLDGLG